MEKQRSLSPPADRPARTDCEFIDLGSSCGSKLNGRPVLRSRLRHGDILEVGHSVLIFHLKRAGWLSLFWT